MADSHLASRLLDDHVSYATQHEKTWLQSENSSDFQAWGADTIERSATARHVAVSARNALLQDSVHVMRYGC